MEKSFYNLFVVVFKSSPWSQSEDGKLYATKEEAETFVKVSETTTPTFQGCRPETLKVVTLDEFVDNVRQNAKEEGYESGRESCLEFLP